MSVCLSVCLCSAATQLKSKELSLPEGKVRVKLDHDGAVLDVDEDDVEKVCGRLMEGTRGGPCRAGQAVCWHGQPDLLLLRCPPVCPIPQANAPSCDRLEDLASLVYLNESSVLHTLRQEFNCPSAPSGVFCAGCLAWDPEPPFFALYSVLMGPGICQLTPTRCP